jgi:hypothetical protein
METTLTLGELNDIVPHADTDTTLTALIDATLVAQRLTYAKPMPSQHQAHGAAAMAMRSMDPSLALPDLLRANLRVTLTWSKAKAAVAALVSALYALEYYSLNELVEEVAALCNRYPQDSDVFAVSTLCPPEVTRAALWHCTAAINFSRQTFDKVMAVSPQSRAEYLDLTPEAFEPPVTDEEMRLVVTLLKEWEGPLVSLVETVRLLQASPGSTVNV